MGSINLTSWVPSSIYRVWWALTASLCWRHQGDGLEVVQAQGLARGVIICSKFIVGCSRQAVLPAAVGV